MTVMIDTLQFAERFESAGFEHNEARALASAFALANDVGREDLVTKSHLDMRLGEFEYRITQSMTDLDGRVGKQIMELDARVGKQITELDARLGKQILELDGRVGKQISELDGRVGKQISELEVRLTRQIGEIGNGLSNRLWSTVAIIAGVSTAISATIGAAVALLLRHGM